MEGTAVHKQWTKYCRDLYNYKLYPDTSILLSDHTRSSETEDLPVLQAEVEDTVQGLRTGKAPGVDNVPSEFLKHGVKELEEALTVCVRRSEAQRSGLKNGLNLL